MSHTQLLSGYSSLIQILVRLINYEITLSIKNNKQIVCNESGIKKVPYECGKNFPESAKTPHHHHIYIKTCNIPENSPIITYLAFKAHLYL